MQRCMWTRTSYRQSWLSSKTVCTPWRSFGASVLDRSFRLLLTGSSDRLSTAESAGKAYVDSLRGTLNDLNQLGEIMSEMLVNQDAVEVCL